MRGRQLTGTRGVGAAIREALDAMARTLAAARLPAEKLIEFGLPAFACRSGAVEAAVQALLLADPAHPDREMTQPMGRAEARIHDAADLEEDDR
ncbi:hypothetical protein [Schaalia hyovaginalis]|uniref:Uncharacterized protein n=1 Tax=Schaalia hyovaginalis TaxID=29316 RepID=A0A923IZB1_9ACTO|nr:hypothetical protein [Schaalia hyovaginalis]MBB6334534.1 hypothetical protein [Schaalia hyovaginalis]MDY2668625.1 hypothetical protein [Schaalia hyovaginalis]